MSYLDDRRAFIEAGRPSKEKKPYKGLARVSPKTAAKKAKEAEERGDNDTELVQWYKNRIKQLTGYCRECHAKVETKIYQYAIFSVCHILEKRPIMFPSVKTHPRNFVELCPDHHMIFDRATWDERELMGCWDAVWERLIEVYPSIAKEELKHLPVDLRERIEKAIKGSK